MSASRSGADEGPRPWPLRSSRPGPDLSLFRVRFDEAADPRTGRVHERVVLASPDWVNVVAVTDDGDFVMIRQYRFGIRRLTLEIPGGMVDDGEAPEEAARRELLEETGYSASRWSLLARVAPNPAFLDNTCHQYLAEGAVRRRAPRNEGGEHTAVELLPRGMVADLVRSGEIEHSLAIAALARVLDIRGATARGA